MVDKPQYFLANNNNLSFTEMEYRRFGKTNEFLSVITLGGMRYIHGWDKPREVVPDDTLAECKDTIEKAFKMGINLIETAYGYMKSEHTYGKVLNEIMHVPRSSYFLMTKGAAHTAQEMRTMVEEQLKALQTSYFDFYAWHGINNRQLFEISCKKGGPVEELLKMKEEGIIKHVGFSTHAPLQVILDAINTNLFEFVNLHYYYFFQRNKAAVDLAASKDMGVFIISPNDKGGQLFKPSAKLVKLTQPFTPIQWNAKFCLSNPNIHTLTFGFPATSPFEQVPGIFPVSIPLNHSEEKIKQLLDSQLGLDPYAHIDAYEMENDPSHINIPEILRFRKLWKCYDMDVFGKYRYNMFKPDDHWFQGLFPTDENLKNIDLSKCPKGLPVIELLKETHEGLYIQPK